MSEWTLMLRGVFALFWTRADVQSLIDADHALELSRNVQLRNASQIEQERHRTKYAVTLAGRLRVLRRNLFWSFVILATAVVLPLALSQWTSPLSGSQRVWLGVASIFCFTWATFARLGWPGHSWGGDSVVERLDERIFMILCWLGTFLGICALV